MTAIAPEILLHPAAVPPAHPGFSEAMGCRDLGDGAVLSTERKAARGILSLWFLRDSAFHLGEW